MSDTFDGVYDSPLVGDLRAEIARLKGEVARMRALCADVRRVAATGTTEDLCRIVRMIDDAAWRGEGGK